MAYSAPVTPSAYQHHPYDLRLRSVTPHPNPFLVDLRAHLSGPDGAAFTVRGCYDGDASWLLRLCPNAPGEWRYVTESRTRSWTATPASCAARPGPTPGCTAPWASTRSTPATSATRTGRAPSSSATRPTGCGPWATCRTARPSCGASPRASPNTATTTSSSTPTPTTPTGRRARSPEDYGPPPAYAWEGTNTAPDHLRLNVRYWRVFDLMMAALLDAGLTAHLYLKVYNKDVTWPAKRSLADDLFFGYVVARYRGYSDGWRGLGLHQGVLQRARQGVLREPAQPDQGPRRLPTAWSPPTTTGRCTSISSPAARRTSSPTRSTTTSPPGSSTSAGGAPAR